MNVFLKRFPVTLLAFLFVSFSGQANAHKNVVKPQKKAILLVAFGTSVAEAQRAFDKVENKVKNTFPDVEVRWAYTSKMIREKLKKNGKIILSPTEALAQLGEEGFTHVYVQSLHIIPGEEFHDLAITVKAFNKLPKNIQKATLGAPLLSLNADMERVASILAKNAPQERKPSDALVYMGHGTAHAANVYYPAMQYYFSKNDANMFMATVEGTPTLDDVIRELKKKKIKRVWLKPFMLVAGDHANNDMAGEEKDSWKSILEKEGFEVHCVLEGLGENDEINNMWVQHLEALMK